MAHRPDWRVCSDLRFRVHLSNAGCSGKQRRPTGDYVVYQHNARWRWDEQIDVHGIEVLLRTWSVLWLLERRFRNCGHPLEQRRNVAGHAESLHPIREELWHPQRPCNEWRTATNRNQCDLCSEETGILTWEATHNAVIAFTGRGVSRQEYIQLVKDRPYERTLMGLRELEILAPALASMQLRPANWT
jgi:hypothetical protein